MRGTQGALRAPGRLRGDRNPSVIRTGILLLLLATTALPQEDLGRPYWVSTPPRASAALARAREAAANRAWSAAAKALQEVCDEFPDSFANYAKGRYVGTRKWALELLSSMPADVRVEYERLYGRPAQALLGKALAANDRAGLYEVVRRFEATEAGLTAILALADRALLRGQPAEARLLLSRVRNLHPEAAIRPAVQQRVAMAAARDESQGGPAPTEAERAAPLPEFPAHLAEAWPMIGGNARRSRIAPDLVLRETQYILPYEINERLLDDPPLPNYGNPMGARTEGRQRDLNDQRQSLIRPI